MRELVKKVGALALGLGALGLVLVNAALTHGCVRAQPVPPSAQAAPPPMGPRPSGVAGPPPAAVAPAAPAVEAAAAKPDPDCEVPSYMYATKAPVFVPPKCRGPAASEPAAQQQAPANAQQQAP